jgi:hypothetical protein
VVSVPYHTAALLVSGIVEPGQISAEPLEVS